MPGKADLIVQSVVYWYEEKSSSLQKGLLERRFILNTSYNVWTISDFSELLNKQYREESGETFTAHRNTIEKWFKELEAQKIHYIRRIGERRMYDYQDLEVGIKVMDMRSKGVKIEIIGETLPKIVEVRDFPDDYDNEFGEGSFELMEKKFNDYLEHISGQIEKLNETREDIVKEVLDKVASREEETISNVRELVQKALPKPESAADKKREQEMLMDEMLQYRLNKEEEAIAEWEKLPLEERTIKTGFFGKRIEDMNGRDKFIRKYLLENKSSVLKVSEESH